MQYRLIYAELRRKLQLRKTSSAEDVFSTSPALLKAYLDLLLSGFYFTRGLLLVILHRKEANPSSSSSYALHDPIGFIVHQTKIDHFILSSITLLIFFSILYQAAFIRSDKRQLVWALLEDILIRSADLYRRSVEVAHTKSNRVQVIHYPPNRIPVIPKRKQLHIHPLAKLIISLQERVLPPSIRLQLSKLTKFALSERRKLHYFPLLKSRSKFYLATVISLLELEFFILVWPFSK